MDRFAQWHPLQVRSTWLFYAILIDLADAVAEELMLPSKRFGNADCGTLTPGIREAFLLIWYRRLSKRSVHTETARTRV
jgi:hypothetical protein